MHEFDEYVRKYMDDLTEQMNNKMRKVGHRTVVMNKRSQKTIIRYRKNKGCAKKTKSTTCT